MSDKQKQFNRLRQLAEETLQQNGSIDTAFSDDLAELIHELQVHQLELEMQHTELQRAYDLLEDSRQAYADLFEFAPVGYAVTNPEGKIQQMNLTLATMLGVERQACMGKSLASFMAPAYADIYFTHRRTLCRQREPQHCDVQIVHADGSVFFAHLNSEFVSESEADGCTYRTAIIDISQIKQAQASLQRTLSRERELNQIKSHLLEMIAHEFRTPLSTILASVEMLDRYDDRLDAAKRKKRYNTMRNHIWYLNDTVDDIVLAHRAGTDQPVLKPQTFDVIGFTRQLIEEIPLNSQRIDLVVPEGVTALNVTCDRHLFRRIVVNLLQNALKYSEDRVDCRLSYDAEQVTLKIMDRGGGIPTDDEPHIFEMFYRGSNAGSVPGTGVGLYVVRLAVEAHGGEVRLETGTTGTTVVVHLPRHVATR